MDKQTVSLPCDPDQNLRKAKKILKSLPLSARLSAATMNLVLKYNREKHKEGESL